MPVAAPSALTVAEFLARPDHEQFELIDGEPVLSGFSFRVGDVFLPAELRA